MSFDQSYRFGPFHVDPANARLMRGTESIPLTPKAFAVLHYLIEHQGQLVNKDEFLAAAWPETVVSAGVLKVTILELRKALGDVAKTPRFIETVHRRGYRFLPSVTTTSPVQTSTSNVQRRRSESSSSIPRPSASNTQPSILVGRDSELARMREWLDKALKGTRQIVFVTGEAGIGKTTLVEAFLAGIGQQGTGKGKEELHKESPSMPDARSPLPFVWLGRGQCIEHYGAGEAYLPVLEALSRLCRGPAGERLVPVLHQYAPMWLMQMPWLLSAVERETLTRELLGATRERMLREMADTLEVVTSETPLVLVLEDLHWSDYSTLDLLTAIARRSAAARLLVIGTYRPVDVIVSGHPLKALVQELLAHQQCGELPLELLNSTAIEAYLARSFPKETADASSFSRLAQALHQRTSGNPLFLVNVVKEISVRGENGKRESDWPVEAQITDVARSVPDSIRQIIERQSERLTTDEQRLLEGASVVGVDPSAASIEVARGHARRAGFSIDFRVGFAEKIGFREEFDIVFAVDVLEHVEDLAASIDACARALKPGGFFGFLTHNQTLEAFTFMIWEQEYQRRVMPKGAHDFHKFITPQSLRGLLEQAGMEDFEVRGLTRSGSGESYSIQVSDDISISYLGCARKRRGA